MASVKDLRTKALSDMSAGELRDYLDKANKAGYKISDSKDLGKAQDLLKVLEPSKYGSETVSSAKTKLSSSTTPETQQKLGLTSAPSSGLSGLNSANTSTPDLNQLYETAMNDPELKALQDELTQKEKARDAELAKINDNPYYAEARRVGKIDKLEQKAGNEINTLSGRIAEKKADAQVKVNIATQQYNIDSQEYQKNLNQLNLLISSGAILGATSSDISQIALATGMSTEMVKGIITSTRSAQQQLQLATDDNGNVTVFDARSGEIINTISGIGGTRGSGAEKPASSQEIIGVLSEAMDSVSGSDKKISEESYIQQRNYASTLGISPAEFDKLFGVKYINPKYYESYAIVDSSVLEYFER